MGRAARHGILPAMRATTPCRRQGDQVVAPGSTGRRLLVEEVHGASGGRRYRGSPDCVAAAVGGPSSSYRARMPEYASRWGRVRSATLRTIKRRSTLGAGVRSLSPAVAVVGTRRDGALACRLYEGGVGCQRGRGSGVRVLVGVVGGERRSSLYCLLGGRTRRHWRPAPGAHVQRGPSCGQTKRGASRSGRG